MLGLDLRGGVELVYEGRPDAAGARGHPGRRSTTRSRRSASAPTRWACPSPRSSARARTRSRSACPTWQNADRAIEQVGTTAQLQFYDWEPNVLGRPRARRAVRRLARRSTRRCELASKSKPKAERTDSRRTQTDGRARSEAGRPAATTRAATKLLPVRPRPAADRRPGRHLRGAAGRLRGRRAARRARRRTIPKDSECEDELAAVPVGHGRASDSGPDAPARTPARPPGSEVLKVPAGHRGRRGRAGREPARDGAALLRARGRLRAVGHGHQEPGAELRPADPGAHRDDGVHRQGPRGVRPRDQADRPARVARSSCRRASDRATPRSSASRSRSTTRSSRWRRSTSARTRRASTAAPAPRSTASASIRRPRTWPRACASARCRSS